MISVEQARQLIQSQVKNLGSVATPLANCLGGILAESITADGFYPSADRSTMDGYVVGENEVPGSFKVVGEIQPGTEPQHVLQPGEAMRIFTGALIPKGGGRVIMQEDVKRNGDEITVDEFDEARYIRPIGSEANPGDVLLEKGSHLGAAELAILAQVGAVNPKLIRKPVIHHLATGNELVDPAEAPGVGQIRETNSTLLAGLLKQMSLELAQTRRVVDDPASLADAAGGHDWDMLLISGGASVGDYDFGAEALQRLGFTIHFDRVNLRPGKPLTFATRGDQIAFVIPGNPVSHFVCFHVAIRLAVEILSGLKPNWDFLTIDILKPEILRENFRETFWPAESRIQDGLLTVTPKRWSTSGDTFSLAGTNALIRIPQDGPIRTLLLDFP
jgi:molybdopterin molybdotransferase